MPQLKALNWMCTDCETTVDVEVNTGTPDYDLPNPAVQYCPMCGSELEG
jgi:hypothetical protein